MGMLKKTAKRVPGKDVTRTEVPKKKPLLQELKKSQGRK